VSAVCERNSIGTSVRVCTGARQENTLPGFPHPGVLQHNPGQELPGRLLGVYVYVCVRACV